MMLQMQYYFNKLLISEIFMVESMNEWTDVRTRTHARMEASSVPSIRALKALGSGELKLLIYREHQVTVCMSGYKPNNGL